MSNINNDQIIPAYARIVSGDYLEAAYDKSDCLFEYHDKIKKELALKLIETLTGKGLIKFYRTRQGQDTIVYSARLLVYTEKERDNESL
jgi:hypothetical protein